MVPLRTRTRADENRGLSPLALAGLGMDSGGVFVGLDVDGPWCPSPTGRRHPKGCQRLRGWLVR